MIFLEESFIFIRKSLKFVSAKAFFDGIKNCPIRCCSASCRIENVKAYIKNTYKDQRPVVLSRKLYWNH